MLSPINTHPVVDGRLNRNHFVTDRTRGFLPVEYKSGLAIRDVWYITSVHISGQELPLPVARTHS